MLDPHVLVRTAELSAHNDSGLTSGLRDNQTLARLQAAQGHVSRMTPAPQ